MSVAQKEKPVEGCKEKWGMWSGKTVHAGESEKYVEKIWEYKVEVCKGKGDNQFVRA